MIAPCFWILGGVPLLPPFLALNSPPSSFGAGVQNSYHLMLSVSHFGVWLKQFARLLRKVLLAKFLRQSSSFHLLVQG